MAPLLPTIAASAKSLLSRALNTPVEDLGPLAAHAILTARAKDDKSQNIDPSKGSTDPHNINNNAMFALFGLIGAALICAMVWFFFWAKNGGFHFRETDWDDYKTTVLRRRGPNGTLLSNATASTKLGGGSVYKDVDDGSTEYTGGLTHSRLGTDDTASTMTGITAGASDIVAREKRAKKKEKREREKEKKKDRKTRANKTGRKVGEDGALVDDEAEAEAKHAMREYRHERPARVGGLNKESEGSQWDGSTNPDGSTTASSDLLSNRQTTPTTTPTKQQHHHQRPKPATTASGGIRKVYSTADRVESRENDRIKAEARRLQEKGRAAASSSGGGGARRNFSFQRVDSGQAGGRSEVSGGAYSMPGSWAAETDASSDVGTKSYQHHIPGLPSSAASSSAGGGGTNVVDYAEEKRKRRGTGYRRGQ